MLDVVHGLESPDVLEILGFKSSPGSSSCIWGLGGFGEFGNFSFCILKLGRQGYNLSLLFICLVSIAGGGEVGVEVRELQHGGYLVKLLRVLDPVSPLLLDVGEEVLAACLQQLVKHDGVEPLVGKLFLIREHQVDEDLHGFHRCEECLHIVSARA